MSFQTAAPAAPELPGAVAGGLPALAALVGDTVTSVVSSDVFDTVLLRDGSLEADRLARGARRAARRLGLSADALVRLRWEAHASAYRAVTMERPSGEASLSQMCHAATAPLGLGAAAVEALRDEEVAADAATLRPNLPLLDVLWQAKALRKRVVAVSDTWYSADDVRRLFSLVVGRVPFDAVYVSSELGVTKHRGGMFAVVSGHEGVGAHQIVHVGDHPQADVTQAAAAGWSAVHLPREKSLHILRAGRAVRGLSSVARRSR